MRTPFKNALLLICGIAICGTMAAGSTPSITVTPVSEELVTGHSLQYKATVSGLSSSTVKWQVNGVTGGGVAFGTITTAGKFTAPAGVSKLITATVTAIGSDGKTKGSTTVKYGPAGPTIKAVAPNPISPGAYALTITGTGFQSGTAVRNGTVALLTKYVSSTRVTVTGAQTTTKSGVFQARVPTSIWGPAVTVPFATKGAAVTVSPARVSVHLGDKETFSAPGANFWTATAGAISLSGVYTAPATMPNSSSVTVTAAGPGGSATAVITLSAVKATIVPATVTLPPGTKQQFASSGAKTWSALYGTVSSTGLYAAPATVPSSGTDRITVDGLYGTATAAVTIAASKPAITGFGSSGRIPLGLFSASITGLNLTSGSVAHLCGEDLSTTDSNGKLTVSGFCGQAGPSSLTVTSKGGTSAPYAIQIGVANPKVSPAAARRFLEQAAFGPSPESAAQVQTIGFDAWIKEQLAMPQQSTYADITQLWDGMPQRLMTNAVNKPDQLRQRAAFALSQIFVTSLVEIFGNTNMISYQDMLMSDALSNYRTIMYDVTVSPAMGQYLNMVSNAKADPSTGSVANENFAREMMQLFTLGTTLLNEDGSLKVDGDGIPIPTYSQFQVTEFARVYTGWTYAPPAGKPVKWPGNLGTSVPMVPYPAEHDSGAKQLLNGYVSPAGVTPQQDLNNALDNIFNHPNIGPFVSKQLIQHLVKSNPSPQYIARVAAAFNNNGSGVRGDMKAVLTAILLDPEARANDEGGNDQPTDGHLQEPALFTAGSIRALDGHMDDSNHYAGFLKQIGEDVFSAPSVFNYYAPSYQVPDTSLEGGEFQIDSPDIAVGRLNVIMQPLGGSSPITGSGPGTTVNLSPFLPLASNPAKLVAALDLTLTHGVMPSEMKETIIAAVAGETGGNLRRVEKGIFLILSSGYYQVWH